ncbi:MAG TPA: GvpL/GvpF family gas vesicle protein [Bacillaceae bacterium]
MGSYLYLYGLIPTGEAPEQNPLPLTGFDGSGEIFTIPVGNITAIVCELDADAYSEDVIKDKTNNDMEWLQEKAFHHHETVLKLAKQYTLIPLKFCTLYRSRESLEESVQSHKENMLDIFKLIAGNEEWNVKMYCDEKALKEQVSETNPAIEAKRAEISELPKGRQFFEKKKLDKLIEKELEEEKNKVSERIHAQLKEFSLMGSVKRTWSKDVTGRQDNMTWNGVYLVPGSGVEEFLLQIQQYEKEMKETGWRFEATGPWPAYHFSSFSK